MKLLRSRVPIVMTLVASHCWATGCDLPEQLKTAQENSLAKSFSAVFLTASGKGVDCGSVASVWQKVSSRGKTGGRKLEADSPLDIQLARRQLAEAQNDPDVSARLQKIRASGRTATELAILRAAVMDEEGFYSARDAIVAELLKADGDGK